MALWKITLSHEEWKHLWCHISVIQLLLSFQPADESLALLSFVRHAVVPHIRPILPSRPRRMQFLPFRGWMAALVMQVCSFAFCVRHRGFTIQRVTHLRPGSWPQSFEGMRYQLSIHIPLEVRHIILDKYMTESSCYGRLIFIFSGCEYVRL